MSKKFKILCAFTCAFVLMFSMCTSASATFLESYDIPVVSPKSCEKVSMYWNGEYIGKALEYGGVCYVPALDFVELLMGSCCVLHRDLPYSAISMSSENFNFYCYPEYGYISINDRYIPLGGSPLEIDGAVWFPLSSLAKLIGAKIQRNGEKGPYDISYTSGSPIPSAKDVYNAEDLYWLSRVIFSESGTQSLEGMLGVGNVVLNRVDNPSFPDSVYDVIFQKGQFSVVDNGTIYRTPHLRSIIAAKLCLEGYNTVEDCLYFLNPRISNSAWFRNNLSFYASIGEHDFFA